MKTFIQRLETLSNKARNFITQKVDEKEIMFATDKQIDNEEIDIYELPDFKPYGDFDYCAVIRVFKEKGKYIVDGIDKDSLVSVKTTLSGLDAQELIYLADYISK